MGDQLQNLGGTLIDTVGNVIGGIGTNFGASANANQAAVTVALANVEIAKAKAASDAQRQADMAKTVTTAIYVAGTVAILALVIRYTQKK